MIRCAASRGLSLRQNFRIFWDNAYFIHHLGAEHDTFKHSRRMQSRRQPRPCLIFASTSKISYPAPACGCKRQQTNIDHIKSRYHTDHRPG